VGGLGSSPAATLAAVALVDVKLKADILAAKGLLFSTSPCVVPGSRLADSGFGL
jgi:hypothetical protein